MNTSYTAAAIPADEAKRLQALLDLEVLDTAPEAELDALVKAASLMCEVPISLISLIDANRQWFKSKVGLDASQTPRDISFCGHAILADDLFEIPDATADARFAGNPLVTQAPDIRFYAGVPLKLSNGANIGTLCIIDRIPRTLSPAQRDVLSNLGKTAAALLEQRVQLRELATWKLQVEESNKDRLRLATIVEQSEDAIISKDNQARVTSWNQGAQRMFGYTREEMLGQHITRLFPADRLHEEDLLVSRLRAGEVVSNFETVRQHKSGRRIPVSLGMSLLVGPGGEVVGISKIVRDISARVAADEALKANEVQYKSLIDAMYEGVVVQRTDGTIISCNHSAERLLGLSYEQIIGRKSIDPTWHCIREDLSDWPGESHPAMLALASGSEVREAVMGVYKTDGSLAWLSINAKPMFDDGSSNPVSVICTFVDITQRKREADLLRRSEQTFSTLFNSATSGMGILSTKGVWLTTNPALSDFLGYAEQDLREMTFSDVSHPDEWTTDREQLARLLGDEIQVYQRAKRYLRSDGNIVWGLSSVSLVRDVEDQPEFLITQIVDITARKRAEDSLASSNALMEESQEIAKVGGWELDLERDELFWTNETYRIHETSPDDFNPTVDAGVGYFVGESRDRIAQAIQKAIESGEGYDLELETLTTKGNLIHVRTTGRATVEGGRTTRLSGIFQDITERKQYEKSLHEAREAAEQATQSKGQFLANMSHEIRTPMNAILGMVKLLGNTALTDTQFDYVSKTEGAAKSLLGLLNDILDFSKIDAGKMELDVRPFKVDRLMRDLAVVLSANVGTKPIEVLYDIDPQLPPTLVGDSMRLQQVLINLAGNAIKFTSSGQVVISLHLQPSADGHSETARVLVSVQDSGIGIAPENQAKIFSGFSQAEASTSRRFGGTGLGLAISQRLVEIMGGQITLRSALGVGSTFSFALDLPVAQTLDAMASVPAAHRVLLIDDNPVAAELLGKMMRALGWSVDIALNAQQGLECINLHAATAGGFPYHGVYIDWHMPDLNGWETLEQVQQLHARLGGPKPQYVMLSANARQDISQRTQAEQSLINALLVKPVTASMLEEALQAQDANSESMRRARRSSMRRLAGMRVLVVEDNAINQQVAEELLSHEGALVSIASDGRQGLNAVAAAKKQFDAVLMDVQMPVMDGYAATRAIREQLRLQQLPIIGLTANAMASDREACLEAGMNEHIGKPFDMGQLVHMLLALTGFVPATSTQEATTSKPPEAPASPRGLSANADIDLPAALARLGGMQSLYVRSATELCKGLQTLEATLHTLLDANQLKDARALLHTFKGNAGTMGLKRLQPLLATLEKACETASDGAQVQARTETLAGEIRDALVALQSAIAQLDETSAAPASVEADPATTRKAAALLKSAFIPLLQGDDLTVLEVFAASRDGLQHLPAAEVAQLEEALQGLDLAAALGICQALVEKFDV